MNVTYREAAEHLLSHDNYIVLIHDRADGDCLGSSIGLSCILSLLGKSALIASPGKIPDRLKFINTSSVKILEGEAEFLSYLTENSTIISTDVASDYLLADLKDIVESRISLAIDHHKLNTLSCQKLLIEETASSAGEVVYELGTVLCAMTGKDLFSYDVCFSLYSAISSDSGCFKYSNTGVKTHKFASVLLQSGIPAHEINYKLFDLKSKVQIDVERLAYNHMEFFYDGKLCLVYIPKKELDKISATNNDTETVIQIPRCMEGVEIGVYMYEKAPNQFKFSVRTNGDGDMSELCAFFGGGGHKKAAGCTIELTDNEAKKAFVHKSKEYIK